MTDYSRFLRFLRFAFVGGSSGVLYLVFVFVLVDGLGMQVTLASTLVCITAGAYNYLMHYHWTFASDAPHGIVLIRYLLMIVGAVLINGLIVHFGVMFSTAHYLLIQLVAALTLVLWSLSVSSLWVFRQRS
jgi:putative flippase GtrA